jgi:hypothetical protein
MPALPASLWIRAYDHQTDRLGIQNLFVMGHILKSILEREQRPYRTKAQLLVVQDNYPRITQHLVRE